MNPVEFPPFRYFPQEVPEPCGGDLDVSSVQKLEFLLATMPEAKFPAENTYTPGLCVRKFFMPAGSILTSMRHLTEHPFIVIYGKVEVLDQDGHLTIEGPYMGITKAGTKRVLYAHSDVLWLTIHANPDNFTTEEEMAAMILEPNKNPLLGEGNPRLEQWRKKQPIEETLLA